MCDFDPVAGRELRILNYARFDLLEIVTNGDQLAARAFARDLNVTVLSRRSARRQNRLKQSNSRLKLFLAGIIYATADVVKLLRTARDRDDVFRLNGQVECRRIAEVVRLAWCTTAHDHDARAVVLQLRLS